LSIQEVKNSLPEELIEILEEIYTTGELDSIYRSFDRGRYTSFRINTLKGNYKEVTDELTRNKIKFKNYHYIKDTFTSRDSKAKIYTKLDIYKEGKIYLQNISSMLPVEFLELKEDIKILDMCAAPGSKSTQIATITENKANIIANDINDIRIKKLEYNIEKQGATSVIILGSDGRALGKRMMDYFDRVLIDAPCSGEGRIHLKDNKKLLYWSDKKVKKYSKNQKKLIDSGYLALKDNGILIYSTCTLNPYENEEVINYALNKYKDLTLEKITFQDKNIKEGLTQYKGNKYKNVMKNALRIIPNEYCEGFFIAKLIKTSNSKIKANEV